MKLNSPQTYIITPLATRYDLLEAGEPSRFSAPASTPGVNKLYTLSEPGTLVYVGITSMRLSQRFGYGFKADGRNGYHGYGWRHITRSLRLVVWTLEEDRGEDSRQDIETTEAEVAYLARHQTGQWPSHQTEIHFHASNKAHREAAKLIFAFAISPEV